MGVQYTVKRSMSPDGKIDSVSVEMSFEADATDTQAVIDAIASTNAYATYVSSSNPLPRTTTNGGHVTNNSGQSDGGLATVTGTIRAVFDGEPSKTSGKLGPAAIIIGDTKVKTFDKNHVEQARTFKSNGVSVEAVYNRNEKWKSNDLKSIKAEA